MQVAQEGRVRCAAGSYRPLRTSGERTICFAFWFEVLCSGSRFKNTHLGNTVGPHPPHPHLQSWSVRTMGGTTCTKMVLSNSVRNVPGVKINIGVGVRGQRSTQRLLSKWVFFNLDPVPRCPQTFRQSGASELRKRSAHDRQKQTRKAEVPRACFGILKMRRFSTAGG